MFKISTLSVGKVVLPEAETTYFSLFFKHYIFLNTHAQINLETLPKTSFNIKAPFPKPYSVEIQYHVT